GHVLELATGEGALLAGGEGLLGALVAELLRVAAQQRRRHQVATLARSGAVGSAERPGGDHRVLELGPDGEGEVGGQRPGGRGPGECLHTLEPELGGPLTGEREGDGDGLVLALLV